MNELIPLPHGGYVDTEYDEAVERGKNQLYQDYVLTDYPGLILRTYKPAIAELFQKRGIHMVPFGRIHTEPFRYRNTYYD